MILWLVVAGVGLFFLLKPTVEPKSYEWRYRWRKHILHGFVYDSATQKAFFEKATRVLRQHLTESTRNDVSLQYAGQKYGPSVLLELFPIWCVKRWLTLRRR